MRCDAAAAAPSSPYVGPRVYNELREENSRLGDELDAANARITELERQLASDTVSRELSA